MSRPRAYRQATLDIQQRFFAAVEELVEAKRIPGGVAGYCKLCDIDRRHFYSQKKNNGKGYFEVAWLLPLIKDFHVSANWLLFGTGKQYKGNTL